MKNISSLRQYWQITGGQDHFFFLLDAAATVDVLTASKDDKQTRETRPRLLVLANFITHLPPESPRDIAFIPSIVKRVQKCRIS